MPDTFVGRVKHAWNIFKSRDLVSDVENPRSYEYVTTENPVYPRFSRGNERSIVSSIYNRIALDVAGFDFTHVKTDVNGRYTETVNDELNKRLSIEANKDQTGRAFIQDVCMSMFDEGAVAIVPVDTTVEPSPSGAYVIDSMRVGKVTKWFPNHIEVNVYNDRTGKREQVMVPKSMCAIIENPLYAIMNEPNSTLKRLVRKLNILDAIDEQSGSGKLDIIIQLPYTVRSETRRQQAEERKKSLEQQLRGSKYGVAYTDGTEKITQLNRPSENNLLAQIQYLTSMLYNQLGITENIFSGKASEQELRTYYDRTIEPIVTAILEEMRRKFLTKTARTQGHTLMGFRDIFRLVPANELAEIADVFSRNEILSANEIRGIIGVRPSPNPKADELSNKNMPKQPPTTFKRKELDELDKLMQKGANEHAEEQKTDV